MKFARCSSAEILLALLMATQATLSYADAQAGAAIAKNGSGATSACMQCHGANGEGQAAGGFPRLAGQGKNYLAKQLADFKAKSRNNPVMQPIANTLTAAQINDVADYYASLPAWKPPANPVPDTAQSVRGAQIAQRGKWDMDMPACFACHGENGAGVAPHFPALAGLSANYTATQIKNWQTGARSNDPQGLMKAVADKLSADDIAAISVYLENPK